jgi:hypothetical protein
VWQESALLWPASNRVMVQFPSSGRLLAGDTRPKTNNRAPRSRRKTQKL